MTPWIRHGTTTNALRGLRLFKAALPNRWESDLLRNRFTSLLPDVQWMTCAPCRDPIHGLLPESARADERPSCQTQVNEWSRTLEVGDYTTGDTHDVCWCSTEVVIPCSCRSPHFVVLQQIRINEYTQLSAVTKGRHATIGLGN
jgi:hypothetical protein